MFADDWAGRVELAERMRGINLTLVRRNLEDRHGIAGGEIDRQAEKLADLTLALAVLRTMLDQLGVPEEDPLMTQLGWGEGSFMQRLLRFAVEGARYAADMAPGRNIITAVSSALKAHRAHVANPVQPGSEPVIASAEAGVSPEHAAFLNIALKWKRDPHPNGWMPAGDRIGVLVDREDGSRIVVLDSRAAFHTAQRLHPDLVLPGQQQSTTWNSLYADGLHDRGMGLPVGGGHPRIRFGADVTD